MEAVSGFIHSPNFWRWHGFVLSVLWLFGSAIGIALKKRSVKLHLLAFFIVDYTSLFFMGSAIYLLLPRLPHLAKWPLLEQAHVLAGVTFLVLMAIQHIGGALSWHKEQRNYGHRKLGTRLALAGRLLAGVGWFIHQENWVLGAAVLGISLLLYVGAERSQWAKIKTS